MHPSRPVMAALTALVALTLDAPNPAVAAPPAETPKPAAATPETDWSLALVESAMRNQRDAIMEGWWYPNGLYLHGQYLVFKRTGNRRYLDFVKTFVDRFVSQDGTLDATLDSLDKR